MVRAATKGSVPDRRPPDGDHPDHVAAYCESGHASVVGTVAGQCGRLANELPAAGPIAQRWLSILVRGVTMSTPSVVLRSRSPIATRAACAIAVGGLLAGTIDIGAAALINMIDPRIILRFIAGGLLGKAALQGGTSSMWLGLLLQWGMSLLIAAIFVLAALRLRWMTVRPVWAGMAYGTVVFFAMNYVVMFFSAWHRVNHFTPATFVENLAAMLLFGLIVAFSARWFLASAPRA
ncbi:MAG: hypothetical protein ACREPH_04385 [Rhodanobacteraceae bacterium]